MGTNECSQPASKSSWDSQDFSDVNLVLKMSHFHKSSRPQWVNTLRQHFQIHHFLEEKLFILIEISLKFFVRFQLKIK